MQMVSAIMCEFLNMMYLTGQEQTIKSITGFTTIKTLTELDNITCPQFPTLLFQN